MLDVLKKNKSNIIACLLSLFCVVALNINLDKNVGFLYSFDGNSYVYVCLFILFSLILRKVLEYREKRLIVCVSILSFMLVCFEIIGYSIYNYTDLSGIFYSKITLLKCFLKGIGDFLLIYSTVVILYKKIFCKFEKHICGSQQNEKIKNKKMLKQFFIIWVVMFILYIPYFLTYFPGILTYDSMNQISQTLGNLELAAHHPLVHTLIVGMCIKLGILLFNSQTVGVAIYSILQMLFMTGVFSYAIYYMGKKNINIFIRIVTFVFFAFNPIMPIYAITMWKDIPFALMMLLFIICLSELITNKERFITSISKNVIFIIVTLFMMLFRNNGIYVLYLSIPFILWFSRKHWKKMLLILIIPIIIYKIINGPLLLVLNIDKPSVKEALSVPLQQLARVEINKGDQLTKEEYDQIHKFIKCDDISKIYLTWLSDPIKESFDVEYFNENKLEFVKLWTSLFFKYPVHYFEAFFCNNVGYWYPELSYRVVERTVYKSDREWEKGLNITANPIIDSKLVRYYDSFIERRQIPILSMVFSIGSNVWLMFILLIYNVYKKKYINFVIFIPIIALWLTTLASPVYAEYRYIYSLFTCLPILLAFSIGYSKE